MSQENIHTIFDQLVQRDERQKFLNQNSKVYWLTGLSGSGKSTIAKGVERKLFAQGFFAQVLDGDNIRSGISNNLTFNLEDREENIRRISEVAKLYVNSGIITLCSFISPTREIRSMAKNIIGSSDFYEIYINTSLELCEDRDVKGLYKKARNGLIKGFTGIDSPYQEPLAADYVVTTQSQTVDESVNNLYNFIVKNSKLI